MAGTDKSARVTSPRESDGYVTAQEHNKLVDDVETLRAGLADLTAKFNAHTHRGDGAQAGAYNTSKPQSDAETVAPVTASSVVSATFDTAADLAAAKVADQSGTVL